jgi:LysR family glycine cleavage system transcriptional activator
VDCAIRYGAGNYAGLAVERLMTESVFPVCSPALLKGKHPLDHAEALQHHTLLHDDSPDLDPSCPDWRMWLRAAGVAAVSPAQGPRFNQSSLVLDAALAGQGVALAKAQLANEDIKSGRLVRPFGTEQRVEFGYYFICPTDKSPLPKVRAFRDWLRGEAKSAVAQ